MRSGSGKRRSVAAALAAATITVAGCGQNGHLGYPRVPLVNGARVLTKARRCNHGSNVFCALDYVVVDSGVSSAGVFLVKEREYLRDLGWVLQEGEIAQERSALSPDRKLRMTYATALGDLVAVDLGWIQRPRSIARALASTLISRTPAMSLTVEVGPA